MSNDVSVVVLTMGDRPAEVERLVHSLIPQQPFDGVLVGNGVQPPTYPRWRSVALEENIGISAGREFGARLAENDLIAFVDDDAEIVTSDLFAIAADAFADDPSLGAIAMRIVVTGTERSLSEWQPRIQGRGQQEPGDVTWFPGAAHIVRKSVYEQVGGYADNFWYSHEETDLAWRILDAGYRIMYRPDLTLSHPETKPSRHNKHLWFSARNRIWLARKHLPLVLAMTYGATWLAIQLVRCRSVDQVRGVVSGSFTGMRVSPGPRRPMSWKTVARMTRIGRPPII